MMSASASAPASERALAAPPRLVRVFAEQVRAVGLSLRVEGLVALTLLLYAVAMQVASTIVRHRAGGFPLDPFVLWPFATVAPLGAAAVWKGEPLAADSYRAALPVSPVPQAIARSLAGLLWVWVWMAAAMLAFVGLNVSSGGRRMDHVGALPWIGPFAYTAVLYLLCCAVALRVRRTWWWVVAALALLWLARDVVAFAGAGHVPGTLVNRFDPMAIMMGPRDAAECDYDGCLAETLQGVPWLLTTAAWLAAALGLLALSARQTQRSA